MSSTSTAKRALDISVSLIGILLSLPLMVLIAVAIKLDTPGPVIFRQERVGQGGRHFRIHKFRTMVAGVDQHVSGLTIGNDVRITRAGRFLRGRKLDELPQLFDVLCGEMSLVGPRPEVPRYVALYPQPLRDKVLSLRPGITDPASLALADESRLLAGAADPEREYVEVILPRKLNATLKYAENATLASDLRVIAGTLRLLVQRLLRGGSRT